jgi:hypothetical protein
MSNPIYIGKGEAHFEHHEVIGSTVHLDNELFYKIEHCDHMRPFFMSVVSDSNHWMFIASNGGLTAGRKNSDNALFPYDTDDKITASADTTGSKTLMRVRRKQKTFLWEPFSLSYKGVYKTTRNLYKNRPGNKIAFEEINHDLGLTFCYQWNSSNNFGFVKKATLTNITDESVAVELLDGLQNLVPYGVSADMQNSKSNLVDAYKKNELDEDSGIGIFALSAVIVDKAEPSEALKSTTVWALGLDTPRVLLSGLQLDKFRDGVHVQQETDVRAEKGAYFVAVDIELAPKETKDWMLVANVNQSLTDINGLKAKLGQKTKLEQDVRHDVEKGTQKLIDLVTASDGLQVTDDALVNTRHFSNTLFNIMRGGIFDDHYTVEKSDLLNYLHLANTEVTSRHSAVLDDLPSTFSISYIKNIVTTTQDPILVRLCYEYMPLKFSRRHGDPSRPWNKFSINTQSELDGSKILDYEGNWRDIFQNWEALAFSYPEFTDSMIFKFLNASTFDGYNPYRITKKGIDWEVIEPDDPWSYIGYWGDHQIIYLQKFLEIIENYYPQRLAEYLDKEVFVYANVPYKIRSYEDIVKNPKDTIDFDHQLDKEVQQRKNTLGEDGALLTDRNGKIHTVNFIEKLLATTLAKVSNFIPEAGIWLNTQRPEWNDANNALVGNGVSMVTTCYLRRFVKFVYELLGQSTLEQVRISEELAEFFNQITETLLAHSKILSGTISDTDRKKVVDALGTSGSDFRNRVYANGFSSERRAVSQFDLLRFFSITLEYLEHTIKANKRPDQLYHGYNLMAITEEDGMEISRLPMMLEGQVAVLSSGLLSSDDVLGLLGEMKQSPLYRADQESYLLYPDKELVRFTEKNCIPQEGVDRSELLQQLLADGNVQIIEKDCFGTCHFNGSFNNGNSLQQALSSLPQHYQSLVKQDTTLLEELFEQVFDHKTFTGRSGTFYGYEGLGSIYWHMVSKLVLAIQECSLQAIESNESVEVITALKAHYYEALEGLGVHKSPDLYGAIPTDPYSHTPGGKGAQQPGMTGQVKEDLLSRFGELGVFVKNGKVVFRKDLLRKREFLTSRATFEYRSVDNSNKVIELDTQMLAFTICQTPVIYQLGEKTGITVIMNDGSRMTSENLKLDKKTSQKLFGRTGEIDRISVMFNTV